MCVCVWCVCGVCVRACVRACEHAHTLIYRNLVIFCVKNISYVIFRAVLISYVPHIVYETRVKISLLNNIRTFNFRFRQCTKLNRV